LDCYLVARRVIAERDLEAAPRARDARIQVEEVAAQAEPENPLDADAIHPARRPGVPGPPATTDVGRRRVDVSGGDLRLHPVTIDSRARAGLGDRSQDGEQLAPPLALPP